MRYWLGYRWFCVRLWWHELPHRLSWRVAFHLPRRVALLTFIRVYAATSDAPGPEFVRICDAFEAQGGK